MSFIEFVGNVTTVVVIVETLVLIVLWSRGIIPAFWRLGFGLSRRKIAVFAKADMSSSLKDLLLDSRLFSARNITTITSEADAGKCERTTLFLVYWPDWAASIQEILDRKADGTALIIYAPQDKGLIPRETISLLEKRRNVVVSNFRGRLLNDIVVSMITTSYEKK
ncbi:MAG: hypothetical protein HY849_02040 [Nitrosomonadales bacterium]|nr:hypothetical protein [Nitrosomonadales bacterium]